MQAMCIGFSFSFLDVFCGNNDKMKKCMAKMESVR